MQLKKVILILIISMVASFAVRTLGTLYPPLFYNIAIVKTAILVNTFFILAHLLFWLVFYTEYISAQKPMLKRPCILAIAGSIAVSMLYLKKFPFLFDMNPQYPLILASPYFDALVPLVSAVFHLVFFVYFKTALEEDEKTALNSPVISMISGIGIYMVLHLVVLVNFIATGHFEWLEHMPGSVAVGTVPMIIAAVCCILFFYYKLYCFFNERYT